MTPDIYMLTEFLCDTDGEGNEDVEELVKKYEAETGEVVEREVKLVAVRNYQSWLAEKGL